MVRRLRAETDSLNLPSEFPKAARDRRGELPELGGGAGTRDTDQEILRFEAQRGQCETGRAATKVGLQVQQSFCLVRDGTEFGMLLEPAYRLTRR